MMKLYLVQHGEAETKDVNPDRPLTQQGESDIRQVAATLSRAGIRVQRLVHSGKTRARQTAEILAGEIAPGIALETSDTIDPIADPGGFVLPADGSDTLVAGHLPFMARLVALLVSGDSEQPLVAYRPGSVVCLERTEDQGWQINWMLRPEVAG